MKLVRWMGIVLAAVLALTVFAWAVPGPEAAGYGYLAGKEGRTEEGAPYAGMNYEGGEQGDTSGYGYLAGKEGRTEKAAPYAGRNYEGGEQGDTSAYSFRTGRVGKPWNTTV